MTKIDDYIITKTQDLYNYIWDYTGVTKGAIFVTIKFLCALLIFTNTHTSTFWRYSWTIFFIFSAYATYKNMHVPQTKGLYKDLNKKALEARIGVMQRTKLYFIFPVGGCFLMYNLTLSNFTYAIIIFIINASTYIITTLIKDRDPKSFFMSNSLQENIGA